MPTISIGSLSVWSLDCKKANTLSIYDLSCCKYLYANYNVSQCSENLLCPEVCWAVTVFFCKWYWLVYAGISVLFVFNIHCIAKKRWMFQKWFKHFYFWQVKLFVATLLCVCVFFMIIIAWLKPSKHRLTYPFVFFVSETFNTSLPLKI